MANNSIYITKEQQHLASHLCDVGNVGSGLGQTENGGGVKSVYVTFQPFPSW